MGNSIFFHGVAAAAFALAGAAAWAQDAAATTPLFGPAFGSNRYQTSIASSTSEPDVDDYVSSLLAGERLAVTVTVPRTSALIPDVALVGPDGAAVVPTALASRAAGRILSFKGFVVPATGRWAVRVSGAQGTQGAYSVAFKVSAARPVRRRVVAAAAPGSTAFVFDGIDGASLDLTLTWKKGSAPVALVSMESPGHAALPGVSPITKAGSLSLRRFTLRGGDGAYALRLGGAGADSVCDVTLRVTPKGRPSGGKTVSLSGAKPWLDARSAPISGVAGSHVTLTGGDFSTSDPPAVFFGLESAVASVATDGASLDVVAPAYGDGATVAVSVVAKDGRAATRGGYFRYADAASIDDLVDGGGRPVRAGGAQGGAILELRGSGLAAARGVRFGDVAATILDASAPTFVRIAVPASTGAATVYLVDAYGRTVRSSFVFEFVSAPTVGASPYSPAFGAVAGGTLVTLSGAGFRPDSRLEIDGVSVAFTWIDATRIQFTSPADAAGSYSAEVFDSFDDSSAAPQFQVMAPPAVFSVTTIDSGLPDAAGVAVAGGTLVNLVGSNLQPGVVVTLGGVPAAVVSASGDALTFVAPAGSAGPADLVVTDAVGQAVTVAAALTFE